MLTDRDMQRLRNQGKEAEAAAEALQRMQEWLVADCYCPCCTETRECSPDCTFAKDCPNDAEKMSDARMALYGAQRQVNRARHGAKDAR